MGASHISGNDGKTVREIDLGIVALSSGNQHRSICRRIKSQPKIDKNEKSRFSLEWIQ